MGTCCGTGSSAYGSSTSNLPYDCSFACQSSEGKCFPSSTTDSSLTVIREQVLWTDAHNTALDESIEALLHHETPEILVSEIRKFLNPNYDDNPMMHALFKPICYYVRKCYMSQLKDIDMGSINSAKGSVYHGNSWDKDKKDCHLNHLFCSKWFERKMNENRRNEMKLWLIGDNVDQNLASVQRIGWRYSGMYSKYVTDKAITMENKKYFEYEWNPTIEQRHGKYLSMNKNAKGYETETGTDSNIDSNKVTMFLVIDEISLKPHFDDVNIYSDCSLAREFWRTDRVAIYVYNVRDERSLDGLKLFMQDFARYMKEKAQDDEYDNESDKKKNIIKHSFRNALVLCACGCDSVEEPLRPKRIVSQEDGLSIAAKYNVPYIEVSSLLDYNVNKLFDLALLEWWYVDCVNKSPYAF